MKRHFIYLITVLTAIGCLATSEAFGQGSLTNPVAKYYMSADGYASVGIQIGYIRGSTDPYIKYAIQKFDKNNTLIETIKYKQIETLSGSNINGCGLKLGANPGNEIRYFKVAKMDAAGGIGTYSSATNMIRNGPGAFGNSATLIKYYVTGSTADWDAELGFDNITVDEEGRISNNVATAMSYKLVYTSPEAHCKNINSESSAILLSSVTKNTTGKPYSFKVKLKRSCRVSIQLRPYNTAYNSSEQQPGKYMMTLALNVPAALTTAPPTSVSGAANPAPSSTLNGNASAPQSAVASCSVKKVGNASKPSDQILLDIESSGAKRILYIYTMSVNNYVVNGSRGAILDAQGYPILKYSKLNIGTLPVGKHSFEVYAEKADGSTFHCNPANLTIDIK